MAHAFARQLAGRSTIESVKGALSTFIWLSYVAFVPALLSSGEARGQQNLERFLSEELREQRVEKALRDNRPRDALLLLKPAAEAGDAKAQVLYGGILTAVFNEHQEALRWLRLAKASGEKAAYHSLAMMYEEGRGVERNLQRAHTLFFIAATDDHRAAQTDLARLYLTKELTGGPEFADGLYWAARASAGGDSRATKLLRSVETALSEHCDEMRGAPLPPVALERFCVDWSAAEYAKPIRTEDCKFNLSDYTLRKQFRLTKGAAEGWPDCVYNTAMINYLLGKNSLAHHWFLQAALKGDPKSQSMLASMYTDGRAAAESPAETQARIDFWWATAARGGHEDARKTARERGIDINSPKNAFGRSRLLELGYDLPRAAR